MVVSKWTSALQTLYIDCFHWNFFAYAEAPWYVAITCGTLPLPSRERSEKNIDQGRPYLVVLLAPVKVQKDINRVAAASDCYRIWIDY